jgi:hypothetical protein
MRFCKFLFVGCLSLVSLASHAETSKASIKCASRSAARRRKSVIAPRRRLDTLVLRLTGDPKAAQSPGWRRFAKTRSKSSVSTALTPGRRKC